MKFKLGTVVHPRSVLSFANGVVTTRNTVSHKDACLLAIPGALFFIS